MFRESRMSLCECRGMTASVGSSLADLCAESASKYDALLVATVGGRALILCRYFQLLQRMEIL